MKRMVCFLCILALRLLLLLGVSVAAEQYDARYCRDPDLGGQLLYREKKYLLIGGGGAGIGNFLVFYPSAYYFALLTGRDILIIDDSLIGEMCKTLVCGYPLYSDVAAAFPGIFESPMISALKVRSINKFDMQAHLGGTTPVNDVLVRADGFKQFSGWYLGFNENVTSCITRKTGCEAEDVFCHDRHALQRLVRGPFRAAITGDEERRIIGVPQNLKHAVLTLPHAFAPRFDAAIHLRTQFSHFEQLVGPEDAGWENAQREVHEWINCTNPECGVQLFAEIEKKIMEQLPNIRGHAMALSAPHAAFSSLELVNAQAAAAAEVYQGEDSDKIYVYLSSDNEEVKEAMVAYLLNHENIHVMWVKNNANIVHAKNTKYLKGAGNNTGVMDLALDWYALSLSNSLFAWRRNADMISTFVHSAQRLSGNEEKSDQEALPGHGIGSKGWQLYFKNGKHIWRNFY